MLAALTRALFCLRLCPLRWRGLYPLLTIVVASCSLGLLACRGVLHLHIYSSCVTIDMSAKEVNMKWTDVVTAIRAVVSNVLSLVAIVISLRRPPQHKR